MYVEQRLGTCKACGQALALQYRWAAGRVAVPSQERMAVRWFRCPCCYHARPYHTLLYAFGFELKALVVDQRRVNGSAHR